MQRPTAYRTAVAKLPWLIGNKLDALLDAGFNPPLQSISIQVKTMNNVGGG
jgi:hypothetical protein